MTVDVRNQFAPARERTHYMKTWHCVAVVAVLGLAVIGLVEVVAVLWWALT